MKKILLSIFSIILGLLALIIVLVNRKPPVAPHEISSPQAITQAIVHDKPVPHSILYAGHRYDLVDDSTILINSPGSVVITTPLIPANKLTLATDSTDLVKQTSQVLSTRNSRTRQWREQQESILTWQAMDYTKNDTVSAYNMRSITYRAAKKRNKLTYLRFDYRKYRYYNHEINQQYSDDIAPVESPIKD